MTIGRNVAVKGLAVILAWVLMAAAWTPPTVALQISAGTAPAQAQFGFVFVYVLIGFVPWMALTPWLLSLSRHLAIIETRILRPLGLLTVIGLVLTPFAVIAGYVLDALLITGFSPHGWMPVLRSAYITSFYSLPFYVAVVAVGQALAYFDRARLREKLLARAELKALHAQLHPHFLFNTLNAIAAMGYRDAARADAAMTQLSELLRALLSEHPQEIALKDEVVFLQGYLDLYTLLMPDRLQVAMDVEPTVWEAMVPSMLLQPLIENALVHGVARRTRGGLISLAAAADGEALVLSVRNDGPDQPGESSGTGVGLANVRERLKVLYGPAQSLELMTGERPCVTLRLPLKRASPPA